MKKLLSFPLVLSLSLLPLMAFAQDYSIEQTIRNLPVLDAPHTSINYVGSIDKTGGNADWDWFLYEDDNGEWVIMDVDGAGMIHNLVQHRYPTAPDAILRFYVDNAVEPSYEVRLSEIGSRYPFAVPMADAYIGPLDGGRGPIRVVRSFLPIPFSKHCKVTSSKKLFGNNLAQGQSGWGHIVYSTYESPRFTGYATKETDRHLLKKHGHVIQDGNLTTRYHTVVPASGSVDVLTAKGSGVVSAVRMFTGTKSSVAKRQLLDDLWINIRFDGHTTPDVSCPLGAFFGNSLACNSTEYLLQGVTTQGTMYNTYPMPWWSSVEITLENRSTVDHTLHGMEIETVPNTYGKEECGYFRTTPFYERKHTSGADSRIARAEGYGKVVGAHVTCWAAHDNVISCEGDVRVYIDSQTTPKVQSDGSESYVCYGWGFPTPPECHAFGGYDGLTDNPWSMTRHLITDSYPFYHDVEFNIESGEHNNQYLEHSGTLFLYMQDRSRLTLADTILTANRTSCRRHAYSYHGSPCIQSLASTYEGTYDSIVSVRNVRYYSEGNMAEFDVTIPADNNGVRLLRHSDQRQGGHKAQVLVDGVPVDHSMWYHADRNPHHRWLCDAYEIPAAYTSGKKKIRIGIKACDSREGCTWNDAKYEIWTYN